MIHCFGCSFTRYFWPSWADLLYPTRPAVNWGIPGLGNRAIFTRAWHAIVEGVITDQDQVIVQWTSPLRYDLKRGGKWDQNGNVWNQTLNPNLKDFLLHHWDDQDAELQTAVWITALSQLLEKQGIQAVFSYMHPSTLVPDSRDEMGRPRAVQLDARLWQQKISVPQLPDWYHFLRKQRTVMPAIPWPKNPFTPGVTPYIDQHPEPREAGRYVIDYMTKWLELTGKEIEEIEERASRAQRALVDHVDRTGLHPSDYYRDRRDQDCFIPQSWPRKWAQTKI